MTRNLKGSYIYSLRVRRERKGQTGDRTRDYPIFGSSRSLITVLTEVSIRCVISMYSNQGLAPMPPEPPKLVRSSSVATSTDSENWYPQSQRTGITSSRNWGDPVKESGRPSPGIGKTQSRNREDLVKELGRPSQGIGKTQSRNRGYPVEELVF